MILLMAVKIRNGEVDRWMDFSRGSWTVAAWLAYGAECEAEEENDWYHLAYDTEREVFL